jgi:signal transduction histidine kinase
MMLQPSQSQNLVQASKAAPMRNEHGIRTRVLLVAAMALIIATVTSSSLLLVRHRLQTQVSDDLSRDLTHSVTTFQDLQTERLAALERENALLADLPSLKALMTSNDDLTIQDGSAEFWKVSGNDLFALADRNGRVVAQYAKGAKADSGLRTGLQALLLAPSKRYLVGDGRLFACSVQPLYFGSNETGTLLGYVVSGIAIERNTLRQISEPTGVEVTFISGSKTVASTLEHALQTNIETKTQLSLETPPAEVSVNLGDERYLAATKNLSAEASAPLRLVVLKSFGPADQSIRRINRLVLIAGLLSLLLGSALMVALARVLTRPIEELAKGVKAFGVGDGEHHVPLHGTYEVRQLSAVFASMRDEIQQANRALLESERLATIGRMASSVSHDLRHYLAAVYANAEFLASAQLSVQERAEIFADIRAAVHGTTEMIESLLIFSRTGSAMRRAPELISALLDHAAALVRAHPDAGDVTFIVRYGNPMDTAAVVDGKQIERAIYNLLLNACQSVRADGKAAEVIASIEAREGQIILSIADNGAGVPEGIRKTLFDPFISEGKQKGTGLGLTLAHRIATEHGGEVILLSTRQGETIFQMKVAQELHILPAAVAVDRDKVVAE